MATRLHTLPGESGEDQDDLAPIDTWTPPDDLSAREICELPIPELQQVWGPVAQSASRVVLGGKSGEGKTSFTMGVVKAVADGSDFMGWKGCGGTVLIFDLEQGRRTIQKLLKRNGLDETDNVRYFPIPDGLALEHNETQAAWMLGKIIEWQPVLVILDPLYKAHAGDSNDERAMVDMMRKIDKWRSDHGFCLWIPMHLRKTDPKSPDPSMDDIFGSGSLTRGAEVVLGLRKNAPGKSTLYFWKDRDGDLHEESKWKLLFTMEDGFERDPEDKGPPAEEVIARAFLHHGGKTMSVKEIVTATGMSIDKVRTALVIMVAYETIEEADRGAHGTKLYRLRHMPDAALERYQALAENEKEEGF